MEDWHKLAIGYLFLVCVALTMWVRKHDAHTNDVLEIAICLFWPVSIVVYLMYKLSRKIKP